MRGLITVLPLLFTASGLAQDLQRVTSPDRQIEFRLFLDQPAPAGLSRLAYQIFFRGKPLVETSFLALRIQNQEPDLGDNVGLISAKTAARTQYNTLIAEYMQNGSLGRRINVEVRVYNDGVAFRYVVPESTPLAPMLLENEFTEFALAEDNEAISRIVPGSIVGLPFVAEQRGLGWVAIQEAPSGDYPHMDLVRQDGNILISRLPPGPKEPNLAWAGATPMRCPWRVVAIGVTRESVTESKLVNNLNP